MNIKLFLKTCNVDRVLNEFKKTNVPHNHLFLLLKHSEDVRRTILLNEHWCRRLFSANHPAAIVWGLRCTNSLSYLDYMHYTEGSMVDSYWFKKWRVFPELIQAYEQQKRWLLDHRTVPTEKGAYWIPALLYDNIARGFEEMPFDKFNAYHSKTLDGGYCYADDKAHYHNMDRVVHLANPWVVPENHTLGHKEGGAQK